MGGSGFANAFFMQFANALRKVSPKLFHKCPYSGDFGAENVNLQQVAEEALPAMIPTGTYKVLMRFYTNPGNMTYISIAVTVEIKGLDGTRPFEMGK